ncbi:hypothetical protein, partial [Burkholderia sola]|uniref:hypothetical protein n=1 Tax=Burkholderia sola TaxID=2843302 RepID=UPI0023DDBBF3
AIAASGAGKPAAEQLTRPESGHFYVAKSGHFNLATTNKNVDNVDYVKYKNRLHELLPAERPRVQTLHL